MLVLEPGATAVLLGQTLLVMCSREGISGKRRLYSGYFCTRKFWKSKRYVMSAFSIIGAVDTQMLSSGEFCSEGCSIRAETTSSGVVDQAIVDSGTDQPRTGQVI